MLSRGTKCQDLPEIKKKKQQKNNKETKTLPLFSIYHHSAGAQICPKSLLVIHFPALRLACSRRDGKCVIFLFCVSLWGTNVSNCLDIQPVTQTGLPGKRLDR